MTNLNIQTPMFDRSITSHRDLTLTDKQLRQRIRERFLESSIIRALRDFVGYILFMIIIIMVFLEASVLIEISFLSTISVRSIQFERC